MLQTLQLFAQRETLASFLLIAFFDAFFEGLNPLFQRIEQLPQLLLAGLGKPLFALIEDLPGQLGELRTQFITRPLQITQALLMAVLLFAQFGAQRRTVRVKTAQLGFFAGTFQVPALSGFMGVIALLTQQFDFTAHRRKVSLFGRIGVAQVTDFVTAGVELGAKAILSQLRSTQTLVEQRRVGLLLRQPPLQLPSQGQQGQCRASKAKQQAGQVKCHKNSGGYNVFALRGSVPGIMLRTARQGDSRCPYPSRLIPKRNSGRH